MRAQAIWLLVVRRESANCGRALSGQLRYALRAFTALFALGALFIPQSAGTRSTLEVPVYLARVKLDSRAPAVLDLGLPPGDYSVQPASLGYFVQGLRFVYTAEVARGLIYGQSTEGALVVELTAPLNTESIFSGQLDTIRHKVQELNKAENLLAIARAKGGNARAPARNMASQLWHTPWPDPSTPAAEPWAKKAQAKGLDNAQLGLALVSEAQRRVELKELYYDCLSARLALRLSQFDLQLALARVPEPRFSELLSLGDATLVRQQALEELGALHANWESRRQLLHQQTNMEDMALVRAQPVLSSALPALADTAPALATPTKSTPFGVESALGPAPSALVSQALRAQAQVDLAELSLIDDALSSLDSAVKHVQSDELPAATADLPVTRRAVKPQAPLLERLPRYAQIQGRPEGALPMISLLLELTRGYPGAAAAGKSDAAAPPAGRADYAPNEVEYGLLAVDRCLRGADALLLKRLLDAVLDNPEEHEMSAHDLSLLKLLRWYADLPRPSAAQRLYHGVSQGARGL